MGHKILKDHAHTICQMFVGWRMSQDLELFATIPQGQLSIDILRATCTHESLGAIDTHIAGEISAWFRHRMTVHQIAESVILQAILTVQLKRTPQTSKRDCGVVFDWQCEGIIRTIDREYRSQLHEPHTWIPAAASNARTGTNKTLGPSCGSDGV